MTFKRCHLFNVQNVSSVFILLGCSRCVCVIKRAAVLEGYSKLFLSDNSFMHLFICLFVYHRGVFSRFGFVSKLNLFYTLEMIKIFLSFRC